MSCSMQGEDRTPARARYAGEATSTDARKPVVRIATFEKALYDALFEQSLQAPLGAQFRQAGQGDSRRGYQAGARDRRINPAGKFEGPSDALQSGA